MKVYLSDDNPLSVVYLRYKELLGKSKKYDLVIEKKDLTSEILCEHKNILLLERMDGASIWCRGLLKHPHVKTLLKMYHYPSLSVNNAPCVDGRAFVPSNGSERKPEPELTPGDMAKVMPGFNFFHYSRMDILFDFVKEVKIKPVRDRELLSFFAGTTVYNEESASGRWITKHRRGCVAALSAWKDQGEPIVFASRRGYSSLKYLELMSESKIIFSPFGWGEFCYRDYEALVCGCLLVKPFMPRVVQEPDIFSMFHCWETAGKFKNKNIEWEDYEQHHEELIEAKANERKIIERVLE